MFKCGALWLAFKLGNPPIKPIFFTDSQPQPTVTMADSVTEQPVHTAYIEGLPYETNEEEIREFLEGKGVQDVLDIRLPRWQDSGRARGYCHIDLESQEALDKILTLDRCDFGKRYLSIKQAKARGASKTSGPEGGPPEGCTTLFVKNLPYETDEDTVEEAFVRYGEVASVRLARWNHTGKLKGFGYVEFTNPKSVAKVIKASADLQVGGRRVRVDYEAPGSGPKKSFRNAAGRQWHRFEGRKRQKIATSRTHAGLKKAKKARKGKDE